MIGSFEKDGKWWTYDWVDALHLDRECLIEDGLQHLQTVHARLAAEGWTELKLKIGGRYDQTLGIQGVRLESAEETADRIRNEREIKEQHRRHELAEYQRLKKTYG